MNSVYAMIYIVAAALVVTGVFLMVTRLDVVRLLRRARLPSKERGAPVRGFK